MTNFVRHHGRNVLLPFSKGSARGQKGIPSSVFIVSCESTPRVVDINRAAPLDTSESNAYVMPTSLASCAVDHLPSSPIRRQSRLLAVSLEVGCSK